MTTLNNFQAQYLAMKEEVLLTANMEIKLAFESLSKLDSLMPSTEEEKDKEGKTDLLMQNINRIMSHISPQHFVNIKAFNRSCRHICSVKTLAELTLASEKQ